MNASQILTQARLKTGTSSTMTDFTDASLADTLNIAYHELEDWACSSYYNDLFFAEYKTDTEEDQARYSLDEYFKKVVEVGIKWDSTQTEYDRLVESEGEKTDGLHDSDVIGSKKFYDIQGNYLTLYPAPTETVTDGLYVNVVTNLVDINETTLSANIFPGCKFQKQFQNLLVYWLMPHLYYIKGELNNVKLAEATLERQKDKVLSMLRSTEGKVHRRNTSLDNYFMR